MSRKRRQRLMHKVFSTEILRLSHEARGIANIEGKTVFLSGGLPGETVNFEYTRLRSKRDEGRVLEVTANPSPLREEPICKHFGVCGGCALQHLKHDVQLSHKENLLKELFEHQAGVAPTTWLPPLTGKTKQYRHKARIGVKSLHSKNKMVIGFREKYASLIADISSCPILHTSVGENIEALKAFFYTLDIREHIPQLEIAVGDGETAIIIRHLQPFTQQDLGRLRTFADTHHFIFHLQSGGPETVRLFYPEDANPLLHYTLHRYNLTFHFHPSQFIQINPSINEAMIDRAITLLDIQPTDTVLDLFCGIGNFTLPIAQAAKHVTGIEGEDSAVTRARDNAKANAIDNVSFHTANLFENCEAAPWATQAYEKILLDPPRSGAQEILTLIPQWRPQRIVYVSCNPATLARDSKILIDQGYTLENAGIMDMFPHTQHAEAIALFTR